MTDFPDIPQRRAQVQSVQIDGDDLLAVILDGEGVAVPIRLVCRSLSLAVERQSALLRDHDVLAQGLRIVRVPLGGRIQSVLAILHTHIAFWLATILPREVGPEARPKLIRYQQELVVMLNALYGPHLPSMSAPASTDAALVPASSAALIQELRTLRETLLAALADQQTTADKVTNLDVRLTMVEDVVEDLRQIAKISAAQAEYIQRAIKRLAARYQQRTRSERNMYERLFAEFKIAMGIPRYDALPAKQYDRALAWLSQQAATYLPDDPDALPPHQEQLV